MYGERGEVKANERRRRVEAMSAVCGMVVPMAAGCSCSVRAGSVMVGSGGGGGRGGADRIAYYCHCHCIAMQAR